MEGPAGVGDFSNPNASPTQAFLTLAVNFSKDLDV